MISAVAHLRWDELFRLGFAADGIIDRRHDFTGHPCHRRFHLVLIHPIVCRHKQIAEVANLLAQGQDFLRDRARIAMNHKIVS